MSTSSLGTGTLDAAAPLTFHGRPLGRLSVAQYEAMVESGVLTKHDRLELIEGSLVQKMTKNPPHTIAVGLCDDALRSLLPPGWHTRVEGPVRIPGRDSEPEPDLAVVRGGRRGWEEEHPGPPDVALVVEVSDASLAADRALAVTYLGGGIPAYWLLNVRDRRLEVYLSGVEGPTIIDESGSADLVLDGATVGRIAVADMLPRA